jgi:hypothetical protein
MLSYHSDPAIKAKYLARVEGHAEADEIIKGRYWEAGKGCAVGCTIHGDSHADFETELGIPRILAWMEDVIFEGLPNRAAKTWPERFLQTIEPGKDMSRVAWQLLHWLLTDDVRAEPDPPAVSAAVKQCAEALLPLAQGRAVDQAAAERAAAAASAVVQTSEAVTAERTAWIAESAALAAEAAALSLTSSDESAERAATAVSAAIARSADYLTVSDKLLDLLKAA